MGAGTTISIGQKVESKEQATAGGGGGIGIAYEELTKTMTVPGGRSGAIWQQWNWFTLKRHRGTDLEVVGAAADFGSNSWSIDDFPDE